jgi:hypothetical protein
VAQAEAERAALIESIRDEVWGLLFITKLVNVWFTSVS